MQKLALDLSSRYGVLVCELRSDDGHSVASRGAPRHPEKSWYTVANWPEKHALGDHPLPEIHAV
jgi:hypothetical protein